MCCVHRFETSRAENNLTCTPPTTTPEATTTTTPAPFECAIGTYLDPNVTDSCLECPANSNTSDVGSVSVSNCTCNRGYAFPNVMVIFTIRSFPLSTMFCCSSFESASKFRFISNKENGGSGLCVSVCPKGTYRSMGNSTSCISCPSNSNTSTSGAADVTDCTCNDRSKHIPEEK